MPASYGKLSPAHKEAIYLLKKEGLSGAKIRKRLALGDYKLPGSDEYLKPISISGDTANKAARKLMDERDELYKVPVQNKPPAEGVRILAKRLLIVATRETVRLERAVEVGRLDSSKLSKLAQALDRLQRLVERIEENEQSPPSSNGAAGPDQTQGGSSFAESLVSDEPETAPETPQEPALEPEPPIGDVVVQIDDGPPLVAPAP